MRVALVYPANKFLDEKSYRMMGVIPHLGLLSIGGMLQKHGIECKFVDGFNHMWNAEQTYNDAKAFDPKYYFLTTLTSNFHMAVEIATLIKSKDPNGIVIVGGQHPTNMPEQTLETGVFDYVITGEGDFTTYDLINALENKQPIDNIPGLAYQKLDGTIHKVCSQVIPDLGVLPKRAWNLIDPLKYKPSPASYKFLPAISTMMQRGCPKACTFCSVNSMFKYKTRQHSLEFLEDEIVMFKAMGIHDFNFWDSVFTHDRDWTIEACKIFKKHDIHWNCIGRLDEVDEELLHIMKDSNCYEMGYGVESGVQKSLDMMQKQQKVEDVGKIVALTKKVGIKAKCFFIVGFPWETEEDVKTTIDFAFKLRPEIAAFSIATPYPGSRWWDKYKHQYQSVTSYDDIDNLSGKHLIARGVDHEKLVKMTESARFRYYINPKYFLTVLRHIKSWKDLMLYVRGFWEIFA